MEIRQNWELYLDAAERKIEIAKYHCLHLAESLKDNTPIHGNFPPIAVQAHFEGVVFSSIAAIDQLCQAVNSSLNLRASPNTLFEKASQGISKMVPEFENWQKDLIGVDLRRIRTRMVHYSYEKKPLGPLWCVETSGVDYPGERDLLTYSKHAITYVGQLQPTIDELRRLLKRG